jgi:hypothetical protein
MRAPNVDDGHVIGINPLPSWQLIEQTYSPSRREQQRCVNHVFIEQSDKIRHIIKRNGSQIAGEKGRPIKFGTCIDERRNALEDQISAEVVVI